MTDQRAFFDLLDFMESEKFVPPDKFFDLMRDAFSILDMLYVDIDAAGPGFLLHRLHHTTVPANPSSYIEQQLHRLATTPYRQGNVRPIDWSTVRRQDPASDPLFSAWTARTRGTEGVTIPLVTPSRRLAYIAIAVDKPSVEWPSYRRCHLGDFQLLANLFHASMLESDEQRDVDHKSPMSLTHRETEVLSWAAAGKSYWEIGCILGITERTVRFFMTNARRKLNVVSNTQAVAQAVRHDLLPPM